MSRFDARGSAISGAAPAALDAYERALATFQSWRQGAEAELRVALDAAPGFVMAHVLDAYLHLSSRDPQRVRSASPALARAASLPANERERRHIAAIEAVLADDYDGAKQVLGEALSAEPRDVLALQMAHAFDYLTGDFARIESRVAAVLPAWSPGLPGYHAVLAMHAFGLQECGQFERAEQRAQAALALNAKDARAHHVMAHIFEMTGRPAAGVRWMLDQAGGWAAESVVGTHCWWHVALFEAAQGHSRRALAIYDSRLRGSTDIADLIDSASLLWRLLLRGADCGDRFEDVASVWAAHIDDAFCTFSDLHAMLAFVGARDWMRAAELGRALERRQSLGTRYGETTRVVGMSACSAILAFGRGDNERAAKLLERLPAFAYRLGGSHAQRDILNLTRVAASARIRKPARRLCFFPVPAGAPV